MSGNQGVCHLEPHLLRICRLRSHMFYIRPQPFHALTCSAALQLQQLCVLLPMDLRRLPLTHHGVTRYTTHTTHNLNHASAAAAAPPHAVGTCSRRICSLQTSTCQASLQHCERLVLRPCPQRLRCSPGRFPMLLAPGDTLVHTSMAPPALAPVPAKAIKQSNKGCPDPDSCSATPH